jgi:hypothetical protein
MILFYFSQGHSYLDNTIQRLLFDSSPRSATPIVHTASANPPFKTVSTNLEVVIIYEDRCDGQYPFTCNSPIQLLRIRLRFASRNLRFRGHRRKTWTNDDVCWPEELLSKEEALSHTRVLTFGYDANVVKFMGRASLSTLFDHSLNLLKELWRERRQEAVSLVILKGMIQILSI